MRPVKKIAVLHDLCGVGKAALTNMIPPLSVMGVEVCPIPTILLSTHTGGYGRPAIEKISTQYICECADHYVEQGVHFDLIFVGYLGSVGMIEAVEYFLSSFPGTEVVLDPIMGDHGRFYTNFDNNYAKALKRLLNYAHILIPNLTEGCLLTDLNYEKEMSMESITIICDSIEKLGADCVIMTSIPTANEKRGIAIYENGKLAILEKDNLPCDFHGSGDAFDGVFLGAYLQGKSLSEAVEQAHDFVYACIEESSKYDFAEREGLLIENTLSKLV